MQLHRKPNRRFFVTVAILLNLMTAAHAAAASCNAYLFPQSVTDVSLATVRVDRLPILHDAEGCPAATTDNLTFVPVSQYAVEASALQAQLDVLQQRMGIQLRNLTQALRDTVPGFSDRYDELCTSEPKSVLDAPATEVASAVLGNDDPE